MVISQSQINTAHQQHLKTNIVLNQIKIAFHGPYLTTFIYDVVIHYEILDEYWLLLWLAEVMLY